MKLVRKRIRRSMTDDSGLSLMEVIIAITIIAIVASAVGVLTIRGVNAAGSQNNRQTAVTLANGALEAASAQTPTYTTISGFVVPAILVGRTKALVASTWVSTGAGAAQTYQAWDTSGGSSPVVPLSSIQTLAGTKYTVTTMIGTCYELTSSAATDCGLAPGYPQSTPPATTPVSYVQLLRVIAVVSWTTGAACSVTACSYSVATLLDPNNNLTWVVH